MEPAKEQDHKEHQFKKLNQLLSTSFNNVKYDYRSLNERLEILKNHLANLSADSIYKALEEQNRIILEQQRSINLLMSRIEGLESMRREQRGSESHEIILVAPAEEKMAEAKEEKRPAAKPKEDVFKELEQTINIDGKTALSALKQEKPRIKNGEVRITNAQLKAPGNGKTDLNGEWIEVTGYNVDMTGFELHDKSKKHTFRFPEGFVIYGPVKIFTGKGKNRNTKLYWNSPRPIWNDNGDIITLKDAKGKVISKAKSDPEYSFHAMK